MSVYLNYLIESNFGLIVSLLFFVVFLRNENQFSFKRAYLLVGIFASLFFPLIKIQTTSNTIPSFSQVITTYFLPELVIGGSRPTIVTSLSMDFWTITIWIYFTVSFLLLAILIVKLSQLLFNLRRAKSILLNNTFHIIENESDLVAFSFFHYIFIGNSSSFSPEEKEQIINHEITHATKYHSVDILLVEFLKIIFWFNPAVYYLKSAFTSIHEFQADQLAVNDKDVNQYCNLLARVALQSADYPIANYFNNSLTLKRIAMMKTAKTKLNRWKSATIAPLVIGLFILIACQDQIVNDIKEIAGKSTMVDPENYSDQVKQLVEKLQTENPSKSFFVMDLTEVDAQKKFEELEAEYKAMFKGLVVEGPKGGKFTIFEKGERTQQLADLTKTDDEVFTIVEEPASPAEGMTAFFSYIAANMHYPEQARKLGIEGKVLVEFIIDKDGSIREVKSLKGIGAGCDIEAVRVIAEAAKWTPAKQNGKIVKQRLVLPITFAFK